MNPGGGSGRDEPPLDVQIPDDASELDRDVLAYHRELRARRRRRRLQRLAGPFAGRGTIMPVLASILAVCLVAGAMLSVATFSPATAPAVRGPGPLGSAAPTATAAQPRPSSATLPGPAASGPAPSAPGRSPGRASAPAASPARPAPTHRVPASGAP